MVEASGGENRMVDSIGGREFPLVSKRRRQSLLRRVWGKVIVIIAMKISFFGVRIFEIG